MSFQHPVLGAEVAIAETAVADDSLGSFLALLEIATRLARSHAGWLWRERWRREGADKEATPKSGLGAEMTLSVVGAVGEGFSRVV